MTSPFLSLGPVLDLIERWQRLKSEAEAAFSRDWQERTEAQMEAIRQFDEVEESLYALDLSALKVLAAQHAAQLREAADLLDDYYNGQSYVPSRVKAVCDFLAAPRREPEAE